MKQNSRKNAGMWKVSYFDRVGICRVCDPPQAENPAWQDLCTVIGKFSELPHNTKAHFV